MPRSETQCFVPGKPKAEAFLGTRSPHFSPSPRCPCLGAGLFQGTPDRQRDRAVFFSLRSRTSPPGAAAGPEGRAGRGRGVVCVCVWKAGRGCPCVWRAGAEEAGRLPGPGGSSSSSSSELLPGPRSRAL